MKMKLEEIHQKIEAQCIGTKSSNTNKTGSSKMTKENSTNKKVEKCTKT